MNHSGITTNLNHRKSSRLAEKQTKESKNLILTSENDLGVYRNGGRRGASYGPQSILSQFKKFAQSEIDSFEIQSISNSSELDFNKMQMNSIGNIKHHFNKLKRKNIVHLGGGHDHIYPLLKGIEDQFKKILILNIDPHLDTRTDSIFHSGTPFRQFSNNGKSKINLIQLGTEGFSNDPSNYETLDKNEMLIFTFDEIKSWSNNFSLSLKEVLHEKINLDHADLIITSLDCDAITPSIMEGVSSSNPEGFPAHSLFQILDWVKNSKPMAPNILGIYEYNPLFDNLSFKGAKLLAKLIHTFLK